MQQFEPSPHCRPLRCGFAGLIGYVLLSAPGASAQNPGVSVRNGGFADSREAVFRLRWRKSSDCRRKRKSSRSSLGGPAGIVRPQDFHELRPRCGMHPEDCRVARTPRLSTASHRSGIQRLPKLVALVQKQGDSFDEGIRVALQSILVSPAFLFRIERDPATGSGPYRVSDYQLASQLSYFPWSSMPDEELPRLADQHRPSELSVCWKPRPAEC